MKHIIIASLFFVALPAAAATCIPPTPFLCSGLTNDQCLALGATYNQQQKTYDSCISLNACVASMPAHAKNASVDTGECTWTCESGYYPTVSNTCAPRIKPATTTAATSTAALEKQIEILKRLIALLIQQLNAK